MIRLNLFSLGTQTSKTKVMHTCSYLRHSLITVPLHRSISDLGIAHEGFGQFDRALKTYLRALDYIHASEPPTSYYSVQLWINKVMYRLCMLSLRLQDPPKALIHFRQYKHFVDKDFKINFGSCERLVLYYWYWRTLSDVLRQRIEDAALEMNEKSSGNGDFGYVWG